jgi:tellurite resistance protein TehA-like permease
MGTMEKFTLWLKEKPLSFYVGWTGLIVLGVNHYFFPNQFLYSDKLSFLTSNLSGLIVHLFFFLPALEIIKYDFRKKAELTE